MPLDPSLANPMLDPYRNMLADIETRGLAGEHVDAMRTAFARMEALAEEHSDIGAYSAALMTENLFMQFSDQYGKALGAAARASASADGEYGADQDQKLLKQTLAAYRDALQRLETSKAETKALAGKEDPRRAQDIDVLLNDASIREAIQAVLDLGASGVSYPDFLRLMIERGLDRALEGSVLDRDGLVYLRDAARAVMASPLHIQAAEEKLALFDKMCAESPLGIPDGLRFELACDTIDHKIEPKIIKWNKLCEARDRLFDRAFYWILAHCSFAQSIDPWAMSQDPAAAVRRTRACNPGEARAYEAIYQRYFDLDFAGLMQHESFAFEVEAGWWSFSKEAVELIRDEIWPACLPGATPDSALVDRMADLYKGKRVMRPDLSAAARRFAAFFDERFGAGEHERRYGPITEGDSNAAPW